MKKTFLAAAISAVLLAGCGGSSGDGDGGTIVTPPPPPPEPPIPQQVGTPNNTVNTEIGTVFAAANRNLTLYTFEDDRNDVDGDGFGDSDCNGDCAVSWPPLVAAQNSVPDGDFTIIRRDDGERQWAYRGLPLYYFVNDAAEGDVLGDGIGNVWFVARPDPYKTGETELGTVFVGSNSVLNVNRSGGRADERENREGFTLYVFLNDTLDTDGDGVGDSDCNDDCAIAWPPLYADGGATATGDFSIITRDDGTKQWAMNEMPLYFFFRDEVAGDTTGQGAGGVWFVARPTPVTTGPSALSTILVGATTTPLVNEVGGLGEGRGYEGFSLYVFDNDEPGKANCNNGCAVAWPPLYADAAANALPPYSLITRDDGTMQWAINNEPLYYFFRDEAPGDINGSEANGVWHLARTAPVQVSNGELFVGRGVISDVTREGLRALSSSDKTGFTLYRFQDDRADVENDGIDSDCNEECAVSWPPLYATPTSIPAGDFNIIVREDGSRQWTYKDDPLYFYFGDASPGDVNGDGILDVWFAVKP